MTQTSLLQRAKQGDAEAIASVINYLIKDKKIIAKASVKDGCLKIILESTEPIWDLGRKGKMRNKCRTPAA